MHRFLFALAVTSSLLLWPAGGNLLPEPLRAVLSSFATEPSTKAGAGWDPDGLTATPQPGPGADEGAGWDPDGLTAAPQPGPGADEGAGWDPNG